MFLGYLFRACKRFFRSDAHVHTYSNKHVTGFGWCLKNMKPTLELTWIPPGWEAQRVWFVWLTEVKQRDVAEGLVCLRGAATSTAGCY